MLLYNIVCNIETNRLETLTEKTSATLQQYTI